MLARLSSSFSKNFLKQSEGSLSKVLCAPVTIYHPKCEGSGFLIGGLPASIMEAPKTTPPPASVTSLCFFVNFLGVAKVFIGYPNYSGFSSAAFDVTEVWPLAKLS